MSTINITDIYRLLFGRSGTNKASDVDIAEHGRAGGISTGTPFKGVQLVPNKLLIDEADGSTTYIGVTKQGGDTSEAVWQIRKISLNGSVTSILFADGNDKYDNIWDNRASLTYT